LWAKRYFSKMGGNEFCNAGAKKYLSSSNTVRILMKVQKDEKNIKKKI